MSKLLLHRKDFLSFRDWIKASGKWHLKPLQKSHELLRAKKPGRSADLVIYFDPDNYDYLRAQERDERIVRKFLEEKYGKDYAKDSVCW